MSLGSNIIKFRKQKGVIATQLLKKANITLLLFKSFLRN